MMNIVGYKRNMELNHCQLTILVKAASTRNKLDIVTGHQSRRLNMLSNNGMRDFTRRSAEDATRGAYKSAITDSTLSSLQFPPVQSSIRVSH